MLEVGTMVRVVVDPGRSHDQVDGEFKVAGTFVLDDGTGYVLQGASLLIAQKHDGSWVAWDPSSSYMGFDPTDAEVAVK